MRGDHEAARRLQAGGAKMPSGIDPEPVKQGLAELAASTAKLVPMIMVPDVGKALDWYLSIGFTELARYGEDGVLNFAMVSFGRAELMINMHGKPGPHDVSLWFYTDQIDELYRLLKGRQFHAAADRRGAGHRIRRVAQRTVLRRPPVRDPRSERVPSVLHAER